MKGCANLRIFLKMNHFNQFDSFDGYFVTPYYPAQKKVLDLGVTFTPLFPYNSMIKFTALTDSLSST